MKRDVELASRADQGAAACVDAALRIERADDDAVAAERDAGLDVALHRFELEVGVDEVAAARPDQHVDRQAHTVARQGDLRMCRCQAAEFERAAQFDAIGAAFLCGER